MNGPHIARAAILANDAEDPSMDPTERVKAAIISHYELVWRTLRRFGVRPADAEDAAQEVFIIFVKKVARIERDAEQRFLFHTAVHQALHARRRRSRDRYGDEDPGELEDEGASAEEIAVARFERRVLQRVLEQMTETYRTALILCDVEQLTMAQAAQILGVSPATMASRLRRAREAFNKLAENVKRQLEGDR